MSVCNPRLQKRVEEQPDNAHLRRQEVLAGHAHITTIDSFCLSVLREHFQEIDPGFRIADEGELKLLQADVPRHFLRRSIRRQVNLSLISWKPTHRERMMSAQPS